MDRLLFWRLKTDEATKVYTEGDFDYYALTVNGYRLMFAKNRWRPDGLRLYVLGDELAKALGFFNYQEMRYRVKLQYSRRMLSVQALQRHFL
jgi:hypothetical protein